MEDGQLSIDFTNNGKLRVTLTNFPTPDDTTAGLTPEPLWEDPETGEMQGEPPVHKDQQEQGETLIRRDDNDEVCGFEYEGFSYGDNISLINYTEKPYLSVNPPEI